MFHADAAFQVFDSREESRMCFFITAVYLNKVAVFQYNKRQLSVFYDPIMRKLCQKLFARAINFSS